MTNADNTKCKHDYQAIFKVPSMKFTGKLLCRKCGNKIKRTEL